MRNPKNQGQKPRGRDDVVDRGVDAPIEDIEPTLETASALPSIPSMSNVGSSAFSGVVNWNAIQGGFQPLPQTVNGRKKLYQLSQFHGGVNQKSSSRDIADIECVEAKNLTFSNVGEMTMLGDIKGTDNSITTSAIGTADRGVAGYGLFQFTAPARVDGTVGETLITITGDGDRVDYVDASGNGGFIDFAGDDNHDVAQVYYASNNGLYVSDANFSNTNNTNKANIYVYREDAGSSQTVSGWKSGKPLIDSPTYDISAHGSMAAGDVKVVHSAETASVSGTMIVDCTPTSGSGSWDGTYYFYVSWLFDGGCETGLTSCATDDGTGTSDGIAFEVSSTGVLDLNISLKHTPHASNNTELGGNKRIEGGRIYFKKSGENERFLLAEFNLIDGVKGALDTTFTPWSESYDVYSHSTITFTNPPEVYTYSSLNGYYANEVYDVSSDELDSNTAGPVAHDIRYKTAVVGQSGVVFIGNVKFLGKHMPDTMMFSMPGKPAIFPKFNFYDSPSSDGAPIKALAAFQDTILQFKENAMYVINVSNPARFYAEASFRDCGVNNPCQVFTTAFGVIFANKKGCFIYDGQKVISLTGGKFDYTRWDLPDDEASSIGSDGGGVPCVGYDPRSQNIIVLKDINDYSTDDDALIYNLTTQSWSEGTEMITNADGNRHTNFIISGGVNGYLSILRDDNTSLYNYKQANNAQKLFYETKDLDFGLPSQTKKLFKVYITYKGNATNLALTWRKDGAYGTELGFTATNFANDASTDDYEVATFVPDDTTEGKDWKSMSLILSSGSNTVATDFEIQDISILYRARPIK